MQNLNNKTVAIFAANGAIASSVARAMASQGATTYLSARNFDAVSELAKQIKDEGGEAYPFEVDATNEHQIDAFLQHIINTRRGIDGVFNGIGLQPSLHQYGVSSLKISYENFIKPVKTQLGSQFLTSRITAKYMIETNSQGTIILLTASLSRLKIPFMAGISAACSAIEGLTRVLAAEFGRFGIKVICINPTALSETRTIQQTQMAITDTAEIPKEVYMQRQEENYLLGKSPSLQDVADFTSFLLTDKGALLNSHIIDIDFGVGNVI